MTPRALAAWLSVFLAALPARAGDVRSVPVEAQPMWVSGALGSQLAAPAAGHAELMIESAALPPSLLPTVLPVSEGPEVFGAPTPVADGVESFLHHAAAGTPASAAGQVRHLAAALDASDPASARFSASQAGVFDHALVPPGAVSFAPPADSGPAPKLPPGARGVEIFNVSNPRDIERAIPDQGNASEMVRGLKANIARMAPYRIFVYKDAFGRDSIRAVDLSGRPELYKQIPELKPHETNLLKKILSRTTNVQVVVREEGKTPDLVVDGVMTEMKSLIGRSFDLTHAVDRANTQVYEHGKRHGLGHGAVAVDVTHEGMVRVDEALSQIEAWRRRERHVVLDKIFVFAGTDMKAFVRQPDGSFAPSDGPLGFARGKGKAPDEGDAGRFLGLLKSGRLGPARELLHELESRGGYELEKNSTLDQARERLEATLTLGRMKKLARRGDAAGARRIWESFNRTHSEEAAREFEPQARALLGPALKVPDALAGAGPDVALITREVKGLGPALSARGIKATIPFYGSARILSPERAQGNFERTVARHGREPADAAGKKAVAQAHQQVVLSRYYALARRLAGIIVRKGEGKIAVVTGAGPGIMEAGNRGAFEAGGPSVGYNIKLPHEQGANPYVTPGLAFEFENFAARKMNLRRGAAALVFFPGGFGTMDEMFEILTLIQTGKMPRTPIVLMGQRDYWDRVLNFTEFVEMGLISEADLDLFRFAETAESAWDAIAGGLDTKEGRIQ